MKLDQHFPIPYLEENEVQVLYNGILPQAAHAQEVGVFVTLRKSDMQANLYYAASYQRPEIIVRRIR